MGKGGSAPAPTPPGETAKADYGADVASAGFGMQHGTPQQFSPAGSVTFDKYNLPDQQLGNGQVVPGGQGINNEYTAFNPTLNAVFDTLQGKGAGLVGSLPTGFNPVLDSSSLRQAAGQYLPLGFDPQIDNEGLRQSYVDEGLRNIAPVWEREFKAFNQDMANRGIPINSEIYN